MRKFFKFAFAAIAAITISTVLVSATIAATTTENVEIASRSLPALNCTMTIQQAESIFKLLPEEIQAQCRNEYAKLSGRCKTTQSYNYQGVKITTTGNGGIVSIRFSYSGYTVKVNNTTWERLNEIFL